MAWLKAALGFAGSAYMNDALMKPRAMGKLARAHCDQTGKPLLLIRGERMADYFLGDPVKADVVARIAYPIRVPDKTLGAVMVVNVLERLKRPEVAIREWRRVADRVFVCVPSWWAPHAWLDPGVRWMVHPNLKRAAPLWTTRQKIRLLEVSDRRYSAPRWQPQTMDLPPSPPSPPLAVSDRPRRTSRSPSLETTENPASSSSNSPSALMVVSGPSSSES